MKTDLLSRLTEVARERSLRPNTIGTYQWWVKRFFRFTGRKPASQWRGQDVTAFLRSLHGEQYSAVSRKQALCAVVFVFKRVLNIDLGNLHLPPMPHTPRRIKTIPTREELGRIFAGLRGQDRLKAAVMYGGGTRVEECCKLRVKDIDFENLTIRVHSGKGDKDRLTLLPVSLVPALQRQIAWRTALHEIDLSEGAGFVELPGRLAIKYKNANRELAWQFLFSSNVRRGQYRWHTTPEAFQKAMRKAVKLAGIVKPITPHTLRHAFTTHALRLGNDIATVQELLGHADVSTTMIYAHGDAALGVSPLDMKEVNFSGPRASGISSSGATSGTLEERSVRRYLLERSAE